MGSSRHSRNRSCSEPKLMRRVAGTGSLAIISSTHMSRMHPGYYLFSQELKPPAHTFQWKVAWAIRRALLQRRWHLLVMIMLLARADLSRSLMPICRRPAAERGAEAAASMLGRAASRAAFREHQLAKQSGRTLTPPKHPDSMRS